MLANQTGPRARQAVSVARYDDLRSPWRKLTVDTVAARRPATVADSARYCAAGVSVALRTGVTSVIKRSKSLACAKRLSLTQVSSASLAALRSVLILPRRSSAVWSLSMTPLVVERRR